MVEAPVAAILVRRADQAALDELVEVASCKPCPVVIGFDQGLAEVIVRARRSLRGAMRAHLQQAVPKVVREHLPHLGILEDMDGAICLEAHVVEVLFLRRPVEVVEELPDHDRRIGRKEAVLECRGLRQDPREQEEQAGEDRHAGKGPLRKLPHAQAALLQEPVLVLLVVGIGRHLHLLERQIREACDQVVHGLDDSEDEHDPHVQDRDPKKHALRAIPQADGSHEAIERCRHLPTVAGIEDDGKKAEERSDRRERTLPVPVRLVLVGCIHHEYACQEEQHAEHVIQDLEHDTP